MKTISPEVQTLLDERFDIDFSYGIGVTWNSSPVLYSGADILTVENISVQAGDAVPGADFSCEVAILDTDGSLKQIYDTLPLINKEVSVYVMFNSTSESVLIGSGNIVTPVVYENKTLRFNVFSGLVDNEVGFSCDDMHFTQEIKDLQAWPMIFGKVCGGTTLKYPDAITGSLVEDEGIIDYTLPARICQVKEIQCPVYQTGGKGYDNPAAQQGAAWIEKPETVVDPACVASRRAEYCRLVDQLAEQRATEHKTMEITDGYKFPQGERLALNIGGGVFTGSFSGNTFSITDRKHPLYDLVGPVDCHNVPGFSMTYTDPEQDYVCDVEVPAEYGYQNTVLVAGSEQVRQLMDFCGAAADSYWLSLREANGLSIFNMPRLLEMYRPSSTYVSGAVDWNTAGAANRIVNAAGLGIVKRATDGGAEEGRTRYYSMPSLGGFVATAGSEVKLEDQDVVFLASIVPGTILRVGAYKKRGPAYDSVLVELPEDFYTVEEVDMGGYTAVEIHLNKRPSELDPCLEDELFIDFESDIGPNPIDIIRWLVEKYTALEIDEASFNYVHDCVEKYPIGFILNDRPKIMELVKDIAFQARCVLFVYANTIYVKYFSAAPTAVGTISDSDIYVDTEVVSVADIEATKYYVDWKKYDASKIEGEKTEFRVALEHNIAKYGVHEQTDYYYTINNKPLIEKTSTFWLLRYSNPWKEVSFEGPLSLYVYNIYDAVVYRGILSVITGIEASDTGVKMTLWLPVRLGETTEYFWAWPAFKLGGSNLALDTTIITEADVIPPAGHTLSKGQTTGCLATLGDQYPSDLDDSTYEIDCQNNMQSYDSIPCDLNGGDDALSYEDFSIGAQTGTPPELMPTTYRMPGTCWWHYTVFIGTCELVHCGDPGPCESQNCISSNLCCRGFDTITCVTKYFAKCGVAIASWAADKAESELPWTNGLTKIKTIAPDEAGSCYDLPHKLWKEPNAPGKDARGIYRDYYHLDNGMEVPRDYYCKGIQGFMEQVPGLCTDAQAEAFREDKLDRPELSFDGSASTETMASSSVCDEWLPPGTTVLVAGAELGDPDPYLEHHSAVDGDGPDAVPATEDNSWWSFNLG